MAKKSISSRDEVKRKKKERCKKCGDPILTMAYIGTGFCCLNCQKGRPKDSVTPLRKS